MQPNIPPTADLSGPNASALLSRSTSRVLSPDQAVLLPLRSVPDGETRPDEGSWAGAGSCTEGDLLACTVDGGGLTAGGRLGEGRTGCEVEVDATRGEAAEGARMFELDGSSGSVAAGTGVFVAPELLAEVEGDCPAAC